MKRKILGLLFVGLCGGAVADQTGAELSKTPVSAKIVNVKTIDGYAGDPIGNVEVIYADGSKDKWTLKGTASDPKVSKQGFVGWVVTSPPAKGVSAAYRNYPLRPKLRLVDRGKRVAEIETARPFIEEWAFGSEGKDVIVKSRGTHGPATVERFEVMGGRLIGQTQAYSKDLPGWAKPFAE